MILDQLLAILQYLDTIFRVLGYIVVPTLVKAYQEGRRFESKRNKLKQMHKQFKDEDSDGGEKITTAELMKLIEESGVLFRFCAKLYRKIF